MLQMPLDIYSYIYLQFIIFSLLFQQFTQIHLLYLYISVLRVCHFSNMYSFFLFSQAFQFLSPYIFIGIFRNPFSTFDKLPISDLYHSIK